MLVQNYSHLNRFITGQAPWSLSIQSKLVLVGMLAMVSLDQRGWVDFKFKERRLGMVGLFILRV